MNECHYVIQYEVERGSKNFWRDDHEHEPYEDRWEAVDVALIESKLYEMPYRVVKRQIMPEEIEVFKVRGDV